MSSYLCRFLSLWRVDFAIEEDLLAHVRRRGRPCSFVVPPSGGTSGETSPFRLKEPRITRITRIGEGSVFPISFPSSSIRVVRVIRGCSSPARSTRGPPRRPAPWVTRCTPPSLGEPTPLRDSHPLPLSCGIGTDRRFRRRGTHTALTARTSRPASREQPLEPRG
jgi:hypothetical protein